MRSRPPKPSAAPAIPRAAGPAAARVPARARRGARLGRRTVLRAAGLAGVGLTLPTLDAMLDGRGWLLGAGRAAAATPIPPRFFAFYMPNGVNLSSWRPRTTGPGYALSPWLEPLAPVREHCSVITGVGHNWYLPGNVNDFGGGHSAATVLTAHVVPSARGPRGPSLDHLVAREHGGDRRLPALSVAPEDHPRGIIYKVISWSGPEAPVEPVRQPRELYDLLVGLAGRTESAAEDARRRSIMDYVRRDLQRLGARVGGADRRRLDEYATSLRELERRVQALEKAPACQAPGPRPDAVTTPIVQRDFDALAPVLLDLSILALRCNAAQSVAFAWGICGGSFRYYKSLLGAPFEHHQVSHSTSAEGRERFMKVGRFILQHYVKVVEALKATPEGAGTLLDNSVCYFASECGEGGSHWYDLPIVYAGRAGGRLKNGHHFNFGPPDRGDRMVSHARVLLTLGQAMGLRIDRFGGDGTQPLGELLA